MIIFLLLPLFFIAGLGIAWILGIKPELDRKKLIKEHYNDKSI